MGPRMVMRAMAARWLFVAALVAAACVALTAHSWWAGCCFAVGAGLACWWLVGWKRGLAVGLCGLLAASVMDWRTTSSAEASTILLESPAQEVVAVATKDARGTRRGWSTEAEILHGPVVGARIVWLGSGEPPIAGSRLEGRGHFQAPELIRNPGEYDRASWMAKVGLAAEFQTLGQTEITTSRQAAWLGGLRKGFADAVRHGLDEADIARQVIPAMVLGQHPEDADELISDFRLSGTLHVFSVSGLHVVMVGSIAWICASMAGLGRRQAMLVLLPVMFAYAWVTGNGPPAVRAAWMAAIFLGAFVFRRKPDLLSALGVVLLAAMLWDGRLLFQPGVQLSYGVVGAIALGVGPASRLFRWISDKEPYLPDDERSRWRRSWDGLRQWLASSLAVSLAAATGSTPLTMAHFGMVTPISLVANLVLLPLVFAILILGLAGAACYPVLPGLTAWINRGNGLLAQSSARAADLFASIPGGHVLTRKPGKPQLIVYDLPYGSMASVLTDARGDAMLFDCGSRSGFRHTVLPSLQSMGIQPRTILLSHPDGAHMGGGFPVWRHLPLEQAVLPVDKAGSKAFLGWKNPAHDGVSVRRAADVVSLAGPDGALWHRLNLPDATSSSGVADDRVAVWRLDWRGWRILFPSDAGSAIEKSLIESSADAAADVIVAGKHRLDFPLGDDFLTIVKPQVIVAKNADYPPEERHAQESIAAWQSRGIRFIDKAKTGAVILTVDEAGNLVITGFLDPGDPVVLRKP